MMREKLSYKEAARQFEISCDKRVADWERIYLTEGASGLYIKRRGRSSKGRPQQFPQKVEEDLLAEVQRLRVENAYLKTCRPWFWRERDTKRKVMVILELRQEHNLTMLLELAACITQTTSPFGCLNNLSQKYFSNKWGHFIFYRVQRFSSLSCVFAVGAGGKARLFTEEHLEMGNGCKAAGSGNPVQGQIGLRQQPSGMAHPDGAQPFVGRLTGVLLKKPEKMKL
ncbi:MAG: helix-turn-helix domain-containing protein [Ruminococcaceae bacterium]|nr:helix-turn-helix domain-containing protein [Oscillospiraceae bacterium]